MNLYTSFEISLPNKGFAIVHKSIENKEGQEFICYKAILPAGPGWQEDCIVFRNKDGSWYEGIFPIPSDNCSIEKQEILKAKIDEYEQENKG